MNTFIAYAPIVAGCWLIFVSLITNTENFLSSMLFKVIPFTIGCSVLFSGLKLIGIF